MKILISGGVGFIGTNVALEARKRGYDVVAFDSLIRKHTEENIPVLEKAGVTIIRGDIRCPEDFQRLPTNLDGIFWFAANPGIPWSISWPLYDYHVNATGLINGLEFARNNGNIPFIFPSTNKVYSDLINTMPMGEQETRLVFKDQSKEGWMEGFSGNGISEEYPTDGYGLYPHSPYGVSKLSSDTYVQEYHLLYGLPTVINRMSCIYGYHQKGVEDQGWADWFIRSIAFGDGKVNLFGKGKQVRDMLWGGDVARLYLDELEAITSISGQIFNVGGGMYNTLSLVEAIATIEKISGKKADITYKDWRHADQRIYISDITKVKKKMNWQPLITPSQGLSMIYEEYKRQGL